MRYYVYNNSTLEEVSDEQYETWMEIVSKKYKLPDFAVIINGDFYGLETMYHGAIDKGEEVLPFVLLYFEDIATIKEDMITIDMDANSIDYFATFEELQQADDQKLADIKAKEILQ